MKNRCPHWTEALHNRSSVTDGHSNHTVSGHPGNDNIERIDTIDTGYRPAPAEPPMESLYLNVFEAYSR
jgi:hypothetical protein